jgi:hypothetical protein
MALQKRMSYLRAPREQKMIGHKKLDYLCSNHIEIHL